MTKNPKKFLILLLVCSLTFSLFSFLHASETELQRIRKQIQNIDKQISQARAKRNMARVKALQSQKQALMERANALQSSQGSSDDFVPVYVAPSQGGSSSGNVEASTASEVTTIEDVKEDMNKAIAELKNQLEAVKKDNSDARVSGVIRTQWTKGLDNNTVNPNSFDVTRAYITVRRKLAWDAQARITLDVDRISAAGSTRQNLFDYIKYAYVDLPVNIPQSVIPVTLTAKFGLQHTCWIDWAGKIWRFENVRAAFADVHRNSISSSADFGLGAAGKITLPVIPEIEYHATLLNGAGYRSAETNAAKDLAIRLNSDVFKSDFGTIIVGFYIGEKDSLFNKGTAKTTQSGGLIALKNDDYGNIYYEVQSDQRNNKPVSGYSIGGFIYPIKELVPGGLLARYDMYDTDTTTPNNETTTSVMGLFYDWGKDVTLSLDLTSSKTGTAAELKTVGLRAQINF